MFVSTLLLYKMAIRLSACPFRIFGILELRIDPVDLFLATTKPDSEYMAHMYDRLWLLGPIHFVRDRRADDGQHRDSHGHSVVGHSILCNQCRHSARSSTGQTGPWIRTDSAPEEDALNDRLWADGRLRRNLGGGLPELRLVLDLRLLLVEVLLRARDVRLQSVHGSNLCVGDVWVVVGCRGVRRRRGRVHGSLRHCLLNCARRKGPLTMVWRLLPLAAACEVREAWHRGGLRDE